MHRSTSGWSGLGRLCTCLVSWHLGKCHRYGVPKVIVHIKSTPHDSLEELPTRMAQRSMSHVAVAAGKKQSVESILLRQVFTTICLVHPLLHFTKITTPLVTHPNFSAKSPRPITHLSPLGRKQSKQTTQTAQNHPTNAPPAPVAPHALWRLPGPPRTGRSDGAGGWSTTGRIPGHARHANILR